MRSIFVSLLFAVSAIGQAQELPRYVGFVRTPFVEGRRNQMCDAEQVAVQNGDGDLMVIDTQTGEQTVLFDAEPADTVIDPKMSLDGQWVYFSLLRQSMGGFDANDSPNSSGRHVNYTLRTAGADIFKLNLESRELVQLTHGESTPIQGTTQIYPVWNTAPCPLPNGKVLFTSNRNHVRGSQDAEQFYGQKSVLLEPVMQIFSMRDDGSDVQLLGHMNLGGALHPVLLRDGWVMWSSLKTQGNRSGPGSGRLWCLWASLPDLRHWQPMWSAFERSGSLSIMHFQSQAANGRIQLLRYYPNKMAGFGNLIDFAYPVFFGSDVARENIKIADKQGGIQVPFQPTSLSWDIPTRSMTPWATGRDQASRPVSHPAPAPSGLLCSFGRIENFGMGDNYNQLTESGICFFADNNPGTSPDSMVPIIDDPLYLEVQPFYVGAWRDIYGSDPPVHPWMPNPTGEPFGYVGTSTVYQPHRQSQQKNGVAADGQWWQGSDTDFFDDSELAAIRIVTQYPTPRVKQHEGFWKVEGLERMAILGEVPLQADGSFYAKIPAAMPFTFQLVDKQGRVTTQVPTWHQVQPGEVWTGCNGCHAHTTSRRGPDFSTSLASVLAPTNLSRNKPRKYEWFRDVKPILEDRGFGAPDTLRDSADIVKWRSRVSPLVRRIIAGELNAGEQALTDEEIRVLCAWIDLGAAIEGSSGLFDLDTLRPTLYVSEPESGMLTIGAIDVDGPVTLSISDGGSDISDDATQDGDSVWLVPHSGGKLVVTATDEAGNTTTIER